jgi:AraC-like DNA-binding protein
LTSVQPLRDPLSEIVALLQPRARLTRPISGAGRWAVRYSAFGLPSFCAMLEGRCLLNVDGHEQFTLEAGDFVLLPATPGFTMSGLDPTTASTEDPMRLAKAPPGELRHGDQDGPPDMRQLGGYFEFQSPDPALLISLLPGVVHVRGADRLRLLVTLLDEELRDQHPGCDYAAARFAELMLIEALRSTAGATAPPGLLRGLSDARLAPALRQMHGEVARSWTMDDLANATAMSRSSFFERFKATVGLPPMEYLLAWRMAVAKHLLRQERMVLAEVAERVGYSSASTFSTAFSRFVGEPPSAFARNATASSEGDGE